MKPRLSNRKTAALTLMEVLVIIVMLALLFSMVDFGVSHDAKKKAQRIQCVSNLKQIGVAYRVWGGDSMADFQIQNSVARGGVKELVQSGIACVSYQVMSNVLSTPKFLICPADINRIAATNFLMGFSNTNVSYFVGVDASDTLPQTLLSGDDNFEIGGVPVKSGLLELLTNTPIAWTAARHKFVGNIGFSDGSVQQVTTAGLTNLLYETGLATNRLAIP